MTRSERARWTDLQVLAFLLAVEVDDNPFKGGPVTTREVEAALGISHGRATRSVDRLMRGGLVGRDEYGLFSVSKGWDFLDDNGFDASGVAVITYPRDAEAA